MLEEADIFDPEYSISDKLWYISDLNNESMCLIKLQPAGRNSEHERLQGTPYQVLQEAQRRGIKLDITVYEEKLSRSG